jgi:nucleoside-diphosphate-sugar epimerase|tara:strand:+ start:17229 stop:17993 length:765 start_codon:yes stop_codon:yes gene_type:complete
MKKRKVLLLGAAGRIGKGFREEYLENKDYQKAYELILGVHNKKFKDADFEVRYVSLEDINSLKKALRGIDIVINMAANPDPDAEFGELVQPNLIGAYNVFEAARKSKCSRVIFASSVHAIEGYKKSYKVEGDDSPKPGDLYGATKAFGEALCFTFSSEYNLSCLAIRIGAYTSDERMRTVCYKRKYYRHVISQRDMGQLLHKCIMAPKSAKYGILSGISQNKKGDMDLKFAKKLVGYVPKENIDVLCKKLKRKR